jgi:DNA-binding transcriptional LysR family regulator
MVNAQASGILPPAMGTLVNLRVVRDDDDAAQTASLPAEVPGRRLVRGPELAELRAFCAAARLGSIGRAARLLQVSQPALSKRLQALEAVAGTHLLTRSTRGVTLTPAGSRLYAAARRLLADADSVEALMCTLSTQTTPVRVAASPTVAEWWLPSALVDLESLHARRLSVEVVTANSTTVRRMVMDGRSDVGLAAVDPYDPDPAGYEIVVWTDEIVVAVPPGHPWAEAEEIAPAEFARTPVIRRDPGANSTRVVEAALERAGLSGAAPLAEIGSNSAARRTALAEGAPVLLPLIELGENGESGLVARRVTGMPFQREFSLVLGGALHDLTPPARAFAQHLIAWRQPA